MCTISHTRYILTSVVIICNQDELTVSMVYKWLSWSSGVRAVLEMKIWISGFESKFLNLFYIVLKKWKIYWSEQSLTGLGPEDEGDSGLCLYGILAPKDF